jgi:CRP/FNR family transcriptional regulator, cyclic AMP receptor protein
MDAANLTDIPVFASLSGSARRALAKVAQQRRVEAGETVFRQGDTADGFYLVLAGSVQVERDGRVISTLRQGDFFGEIGLVGEGTRSASVTAQSAAQLAFIPPRSFTQLARDAPQVMSQIREEVTLRRAWDRVQDHKPG